MITFISPWLKDHVLGNAILDLFYPHKPSPPSPPPPPPPPPPPSSSSTQSTHQRIGATGYEREGTLFEAGQVRVVYEKMPATCERELFVGKLEGNAGKDRSQRSNFLFDQYTHSPVIGMFDAEVCM